MPRYAEVDQQGVVFHGHYLTPIRRRDTVRVDARCESTGTTSFTLLFEVLRRGDDGADVAAARGRNVYVVVSTEDWTKREGPSGLRVALTSVAGQGRNALDGGIDEGTVTP